MGDFADKISKLRAAEQAEREAAERAKELRRELRSYAIDAIKKIMRETGLSNDDVREGLGIETERNHPKHSGKPDGLTPKYRNPNDHSETWAGRGGEPEWIRPYRSSDAGKGRTFRIEAWNPAHREYDEEKVRQDAIRAK